MGTLNARNLRHSTHQRLIDSPLLSPLYRAARPALADRWPTPSTSVVIEGYPRSGNTYAVAAFRHANPDAVISSHLHTWRSVARAVELELPTLVVLREPVAAASSLLLFREGLTAREALREYVGFHEPLLRLRSGLVVAEFGRLITDFGEFVRLLNERFGTDFAPYDPTPENEERVRQSVEEMDAVRAGGKLDEMNVARPSQTRQLLVKAKREQVESETRLLSEATRLYEELAPEAATPPEVPGE